MTDELTIDYKFIANSLLQALPLPVFIIDRSMTIIDCNRPSQRLTDQRKKTIGKHFAQVLQIPAIIQIVETSLRTGSSLQGQYEQGNSDIAWEITVSPLIHRAGLGESEEQHIVYNHAYQYFAVIIEDMSEARRIERVQRDFLANISHELRTPLTSVRLLAETLEDTIETDHERAQEFVEKIETEVQYLSELVAELLELSRIESGQTIMNIEPIGAARLVHEVMARMLPLAQRHRVKLGTQIEQGEVLVAADSKQITKVLVNLVHNAIKFTPSGGTIIIGTAPQNDGRTQRFFVHDTGVGIRAEELSRIFERFYKTDRARSKAGFIGPGGGGTGLGLAIARHVIETHGGHIKAESTIGQGSTFTFTLPIAIRTTKTEDEAQP